MRIIVYPEFTATVLILFFALSAIATTSVADDNTSAPIGTIFIPVGSQGANSPPPPLPARGESRRSVEQRFGEPMHTSGPVGSPPVSQWHYGEYTVYFESDRVIHSVLHHKPVVTPQSGEQTR